MKPDDPIATLMAFNTLLRRIYGLSFRAVGAEIDSFE
jgi:hypothetical protein